MSSSGIIWQIVGVGYVAYGLTLLMHRGLRGWSARKSASFHRSLHNRVPWIYWPLRDVGPAGGERFWRGLTFVMGPFFVLLGLMVIFEIGFPG